MDPVLLTAAPSVTNWITAVSTAVLAMSVLVAALGWTRRQAKQLRDPGEAPGGQEGEDREFFEDVLRPIQGGFPMVVEEAAAQPDLVGALAAAAAQPRAQEASPATSRTIPRA